MKNEHTQKPRQGIDLSTWSMVRRLAGTYLRPYVRNLCFALVFMVVASAMTAMFAWLLEPVFDRVLVGKNEALIVPMGLAIFGCFVMQGLAAFGHTQIMNRIGQSIVADIQRDLFASLLGLDLKFFHGNPSGQLVSRVVSDVQALRGAVADTLTGIGRNVLTLVFLVALMFWQDAKMALLALFAFPMAALFLGWIGRRMRKVSKSIQAETGSLTALLIEIFQGMRQVKAYGTENFERARSGAAIDRVRDLNIKAIRIATLAMPFNETLLGLAVMAVVIYGGYQVNGGALTVGDLTSFIAAFALAYEPMKRLAKLNNTLQVGLGAAERIFDMMGRTAEIADVPGALTLNTDAPAIEFADVSFSYGYDEGQALRNVSFTIPAGRVTALVGPSGSGKTTVMNLVARFYDVTGGQINVGGLPLQGVTIESLRRHIALVSQDVTIFDDTVAANIAYGRPGAGIEEIRQAAVAAAADQFIREMPQGYETRLGEQGVKLSGGQRQRIAIARAILRNAPILLLDEATSALDTESERLIQKSLELLQRGRTVLVIAHRLSTVQNADLIIVLEQGQLAGTGTHEALLNEGGVYARMVRAGFET